MTNPGSAHQASQARSEFAAHVGATDSAAGRQCRRVWPLERLLDEDAYNQVAPVMQFQRTIQVQQQRITELTLELQETNNKLHDNRALKQVADQRITEMTQELENNTVVFKMHYSELLAKEEEIARLKAIIQGLSGNK
ncbi:hypothetical protein WJX79_009687 [Trebouxia sp. C0005]